MDSDSDYDSMATHSEGGSSITSSVFNWVCAICQIRSVKQLVLQEQWFDQELNILCDLDNQEWVRCGECQESYHLTCWKTYCPTITDRFNCCIARMYDVR